MHDNMLTNEEKDLILSKLKAVGSPDQAVALAAANEVAKAITLPLKQAILSGSTIGDVYNKLDYTEPGSLMEFPLDLINPGNESDFIAYTMPGEGMIPQRAIEGDYIRLHTYMITNSIDCTLSYLRNANWPVIERMLEVLEFGFSKKLSDDGWETIIYAATNRNVIITDSNASTGRFTPELLTLMSNYMRRGGGGNSASLNRAKLTDLYVSPEAHTDMRHWTTSEVSDDVRTSIYYSPEEDGDLAVVFGIKLHSLDELGKNQQYQKYFTDELGGTIDPNDEEIVIGLDKSTDNTFLHPVRQELELTEDNTLHRRGRFGLYGTTEIGFSVMDNRRVLLGSL